MEMVRRGAEDRVHRLLFFEHLAEILVFCAAVVRGFLRIMLFDVGLDRFAASGASIIEFAVIGLFTGIANRDDLRLRFAEERPHISLALAASSNNRDVHFFAWR